MIDPSWIPIANFTLNLLLIPLLMVISDIKITLAKLCTEIKNQDSRIERLENAFYK